MKEKQKILVIGACGQIGRELTAALRDKFGDEDVLATDLRSGDQVDPALQPYAKLDVLDKQMLEELIVSYEITQIYHLAAMLSATGERNPQAAWQLNMDSLLSVLDLSVKHRLNKVFWPSSIAVFGPDSQKQNCPQQGITEPSTIYGISKAAGEHWCKYYYEKHGLDVRSVRYPGLISYTGAPGGGTTDYAVEIFHSAVNNTPFTCFLEPDTALPMMYMQDAIRATLELMDAPGNRLSVRTSYNLGAMSFTPKEIYSAIAKQQPQFTITYQPDFRQQIAESWPQSVDDSKAREDWNWKPDFDLEDMVADMLYQLRVSV